MQPSPLFKHQVSVLFTCGDKWFVYIRGSTLVKSFSSLKSARCFSFLTTSLCVLSIPLGTILLRLSASARRGELSRLCHDAVDLLMSL